MHKIIIPLDQCNAGSILAEDIFNKYGVIIVSANTVLNQYIINKLKELGIDTIKVFKEEPDNHKRLLKMKYGHHILIVKELFEEINSGKKIDKNKINQISNEIYGEVEKSADLIKILSNVKNVDEYTYHHSVNVSIYAMLIAKWLNYPTQEIKAIVRAGLLHDIGKTSVPLNILNKVEKLLPEEFEEIKKHPIYGYDQLCSLKDLESGVKDAVAMHHEREDGSGYPSGLKGDLINPYAKIIAVADVFDAITSNRIYKGKSSPFQAFDFFQTQGMSMFDQEVLWVFLNNIYIFYIGAKVKLNSGAEGKIVYIPPNSVSKPIIKSGKKFIDLAEHDFQITECYFR